MKNGIERRRHLRVPLALQASSVTPQLAIEGKTSDISVSGLNLLFSEMSEVDDEFQIILKSSEDHEMSMPCEKVWSSKFISDEIVYDAIGVKFTKISSSDREIIASMVSEYYSA